MNPKKLKLYSYWRSSASWRVRWTLNLKNVSYDLVPVNLLNGENKTPEHLSRSALGSVPVLEIIEAPNESVFLTQSFAIIEWIDECFTENVVKLIEQEPLKRAFQRSLCEIINADTAPLQTPRAQKRHSSDANEQKKWAQDFIRQGLEAFKLASKPYRGKFSFGDQVSIVDIFLIPQVYNAIRWGIDIGEEFPELERIYNHCLESDACFKASPERQADKT